jgi:hypothetical protein
MLMLLKGRVAIYYGNQIRTQIICGKNAKLLDTEAGQATPIS